MRLTPVLNGTQKKTTVNSSTCATRLLVQCYDTPTRRAILSYFLELNTCTGYDEDTKEDGGFSRLKEQKSVLCE